MISDICYRCLCSGQVIDPVYEVDVAPEATETADVPGGDEAAAAEVLALSLPSRHSAPKHNLNKRLHCPSLLSPPLLVCVLTLFATL
jgi:hypothetical protein